MDNAFDGDIVSTRPAHAFSPSSLPHLDAGSSENPPTSAIDLDYTTAVSDGISLMTEPPFIEREQSGHYDPAAEGHPMGFSGVLVRAQHQWVPPPQGYTHDGHPLGNPVFDANSFSVNTGFTNFNMRGIPSPTICSSSSIRGGNQVFEYRQSWLIPRVREPSSSQVTIEDYDERFRIVPPTLPYSSTHGNEFESGDITPNQDPFGDVDSLQSYPQDNSGHLQFAHPTGMQEPGFLHIRHSLDGMVAVSALISTNLASLLNLGSSVPAPAFSTPGHSLSLTSNPAYVHEFLTQQTPHWTAAFPWVDGEQRQTLFYYMSSSANPAIYNVGPEPSAGGDGLPVRGHGSPGNQRIGGNSPAEIALVFPHGPPPTSSSSLQSLPTRGRIIPDPSEVPCPYGPIYSSTVPCSYSTYLLHPFIHWVVHIRDQLEAIHTRRLKLQDGSIINTHKKRKNAKNYISDFCPACNQNFLEPREVRNHMISSSKCSQLVCCKDCGKGAGRQEGCGECTYLLHTVTIRSYVQLAKAIGYSHPDHPDPAKSATKRAAERGVQKVVQQELRTREVNRWTEGGSSWR
ncbi:hypothetical protein BU17DRAFT_72189 [Hysterangium stoloniferum]|nr:hypothetical protein BU17DRAFT_72189 [Hysterangium stoloniferum]